MIKFGVVVIVSLEQAIKERQHKKCNGWPMLLVNLRPSSVNNSGKHIAIGKTLLRELLLRTCCDGPNTVAVSNTEIKSYSRHQQHTVNV